MTKTTDPDRVTTEDVEQIQRRVAEANADVATAVTKMADCVDNPVPTRRIPDVHRALIDAYGSVTRALDRTENVLRTSDAYTADTPKDVIREHADRIEETYDLPVQTIALQLLEYNRREWLHRKPETNGADEVERHGLTATQRQYLNQLQDAWEAYDGGGGDVGE